MVAWLYCSLSVSSFCWSWSSLAATCWACAFLSEIWSAEAPPAVSTGRLRRPMATMLATSLRRGDRSAAPGRPGLRPSRIIAKALQPWGRHATNPTRMPRPCDEPLSDTSFVGRRPTPWRRGRSRAAFAASRAWRMQAGRPRPSKPAPVARTPGAVAASSRSATARRVRGARAGTAGATAPSASPGTSRGRPRSPMVVARSACSAATSSSSSRSRARWSWWRPADAAEDGRAAVVQVGPLARRPRAGGEQERARRRPRGSRWRRADGRSRRGARPASPSPPTRTRHRPSGGRRRGRAIRSATPVTNNGRGHDHRSAVRVPVAGPIGDAGPVEVVTT